MGQSRCSIAKIISARSLPPTTSTHSASYRSPSTSLTAVDIGEDTNMSDTTVEEATNAAIFHKFDAESPGQAFERMLQREVLMIPEERTSYSPPFTSPKKPAPSVKETGKMKRSRPRRGQEKKLSSITRIQKIGPKPVWATRSHRLTNFYELDRHGVATTLLNG